VEKNAIPMKMVIIAWSIRSREKYPNCTPSQPIPGSDLQNYSDLIDAIRPSDGLSGGSSAPPQPKYKKKYSLDHHKRVQQQLYSTCRTRFPTFCFSQLETEPRGKILSSRIIPLLKISHGFNRQGIGGS